MPLGKPISPAFLQFVPVLADGVHIEGVQKHLQVKVSVRLTSSALSLVAGLVGP